MRNKLAIVGCATATRDLVDYDDQDLDIWVLNESAQKEWCKRADAVLQLHPPEIWKNPLNRGDKGHGDWLMSGNTPPVYMLEAYPEVPKAVKYPLREIVDALLPNFTVDSERGRKDFFTSSLAYAVALGIYLGYKHIETFGVELADEEEYREQQPCYMFWNGIAVGRGVEWVSHSRMFDCPVYPLETFVGLPLSVFSEQIARLAPERDTTRHEYEDLTAKCEIAIRRFEEGGEGREEMIDAVRARATIANKFGVLDGAIQENDRYYQRAMAMKNMTTTYAFSRHEFARDQAAIGVRRDTQAVPEMQATATELDRIINGIEAKRFDSERRHSFKDLRAMLEKYVRTSVVVGMYTGAIAEDGRFINEMDALKKQLKEAGA